MLSRRRLTEVMVLTIVAMTATLPTAGAEEPKKLDPVVVTATKLETPASQIGAAVTVIEIPHDVDAHNNGS